MKILTSHFFIGFFFFAAVTGSTIAQEDAKPESGWPFRWITSLATADGTVYAGCANGLLLRESNVVSFSATNVTKSEGVYTHPVSVWEVIVSPDGSTVASCDYKGNLAIYNVAEKKVELKEGLLERWTRAIAFAADGKHIVAGNEAGKLFVYSLEKGEVIKSVDTDGQQIYDVAMSPDGSSVAVSDGGGHVHLLKFPGLEAIKKVKCGDAPVWAVTYAADGKSVYAGGADRQLRQLNVEGEAEAKEVGKATDWITSLSRSNNGDIAVGTMNGTMYTVSSTGFDEVGKAPSGLWSVAFAENELLAATRKHMVARFIASWKLGYAAPDEGK